METVINFFVMSSLGYCDNLHYNTKTLSCSAQLWNVEAIESKHYGLLQVHETVHETVYDKITALNKVHMRKIRKYA